MLFAAHAREADDWDSPEGEVFNSGFADRGFLLRVEQKVGPGYLTAGVAERFRPRHRTPAQQLAHGAVLLSRTRIRIASRPDMRPATCWACSGSAFTGFAGDYDQRTDQDRFATATTGRSIERADIAANDFHVRGFGEKLVGKSRVEFGVDINGRFGLNAIDDLIQYDLAGNVISTRPNVSIDTAHRVDNGVYASIETARGAGAGA